MSLLAKLVSNPRCLCVGGWAVGGVLAQARHGCQHKLDASSFVKECLSEPQSGHVSMKQFIVQLAAGCPPTEGSPFAFSRNDNSCFGWRGAGGVTSPSLGPKMGGMSRILIYIPKCQEVSSWSLWQQLPCNLNLLLKA